MKYKNEALNEIILMDRFKHLDFGKIDNIFPIKVGTLCDILGLIVEHDDTLKDGHSGCLDGNKVLISPYYHPLRQRFTIAHEIGHYVLHDTNSNRYDDIFKYTKEEKQKEREANDFAAKLLMPEEEFTKIFKKYINDEYKVGDYFGVSKFAVDIRAMNIGLVNNI